MSLSALELERYNRQLLISGWGAEGQRKLKASKVVVAGIGGLGCPSSLYLAAAGIGKIVLVDVDKFKLSDLNRQIHCWSRDLGRFKAEVASEKLMALNPEIEVEAAVAEITKNSVRDIIEDANIVVDGMDNWRTRFIINEYCVRQGIPFIHAGVSGLHGQLLTIIPAEGPCLRCVLPKDPPEVERFPVLGATPALLATLQVMEVVKLITGIGEPLVGRMLFLNGKEMTFETVEMKINAECPVCGGL
ncbi:MAG: HesA/MoeB/ThiF family protein [Candidatus Bathyarchaeota archaeon]|nr:HesA/MoeB/ThiF family protein [Candidatus Bathyarchaeota archaeon]